MRAELYQIYFTTAKLKHVFVFVAKVTRYGFTREYSDYIKPFLKGKNNCEQFLFLDFLNIFL